MNASRLETLLETLVEQNQNLIEQSVYQTECLSRIEELVSNIDANLVVEGQSNVDLQECVAEIARQLTDSSDSSSIRVMLWEVAANIAGP